MNKLDLWAFDPYLQIEDPRALLKKLLLEVINHGFSRAWRIKR